MRKISYNQLAEAICQSISSLLCERWEERPGQKMTERETPPSVTLKVYKQVKLTNETKKNGMVYPLFVDSTTGWRIGKWYNAGIGDYEIEIDDETNEPTGKIRVKSKLGGLSFRPGLHFGSVPFAPHIYTKKDNFSDERKPENLDSQGTLRKD